MKNKMLKMDEMFLRLSIPIPPEQDSGLERSLMREGCKEPITTWNGVIIDGHKRYRFCMEEGIEFDVEEMRFSSAEEAVSWVCRKRIPNYNKMTPAFRYLVGKLYTAQKQIYHAGKKLPEGNRPLRLDPGWDRVSYLVAIELHLHRATVESYGMYAATLEQIAEKSRPLLRAILLGRVKLTYKETQECAAMSERKLKEFCKNRCSLMDVREDAEKIRIRQKKETRAEPAVEIPLSVGIKQMPAYDPDMELRGLTLTVPTWIMAMTRVEGKTGQATEKAKEQLAGSLVNLEEHIEKLLGVIGYGRDHSDRTTETVHTGCDI